MQRLFAIVALNLFVLLGNMEAALAEPTAETLQKLASYQYQSIDFSIPEQILIQLLPDAKYEPTHPSSETGIKTYEYHNTHKNECVLFRFYEGSLVEIDIVYFPSKVSAQGGAESLSLKAIEKFGDPTVEENDTLLWDFPSIDRVVVASLEKGKWSLHVYHRARRLGITGYKDTSVEPKPSRIQVSEGLAVPYKSKEVYSIPEKVMAAITRRARIDHPSDQSTQNYVIGKQINSFQELKSYDCPQDVPYRIFEMLSHKVAQDHADDYSTQLYVLKKQLEAYLELKDMTTPESMAGSYFFAFKGAASRRHPYDYSTQRYVLRQSINEYEIYRQAGNGGKAIVDYMLRND